MTVDAWIKTSATGGVQPIVDKRVQTTAGKAQEYALFVYHGRIPIQLANGIRVPLGYYNFIPPASHSDTFVADGQWRHVAATVDRSSSSPAVKLYVDGPEVHSFTSYVPTGNLDETAPLWIGRRRPVPDAGYASTYLAGRIDEVEIFARGLQANHGCGLKALELAARLRATG